MAGPDQSWPRNRSSLQPRRITGARRRGESPHHRSPITPVPPCAGGPTVSMGGKEERAEMREAYHEELALFAARLGDLARLAEGAMVQAGTALLGNDLELARKVTAEERSIESLHHLLDAEAVVLL